MLPSQLASRILPAWHAITHVCHMQMKKRKDKARDGMPIARVLRSVVVAVQGPVCFYLPIKAVLRVGVLLVVALDRQGRMLATSETPRWQGKASTSHLHIKTVLQ